VIAYRVASLSSLVKVPYASLPNLLLGREMQNERLLADCTAEALATALEPLLWDPGSEAPSRRAAKKILELIGRRPLPLTGARIT